MNKKELAVILSRIKIFEYASIKLEQYPTESEIAADVLWKANMDGDVEGKTIVDLGAGHGVLGIGSLLMGAKKVSFIDIDKEALKIAKENLKEVSKNVNKKFHSSFLNKNVKDVRVKADVVIQNPPFGVKNTHADKMFLLKAMSIAPVVYSFHKMATQNFVEKVAVDHGFKANLVAKYRFPLKRTMWYHMKKVYYVDVGVWRIVKNLSSKSNKK
jgi:putative methylase